MKMLKYAWGAFRGRRGAVSPDRGNPQQVGESRMNPLSIIGLASMTLAAVIAGATASIELKKRYSGIIDEWNRHFHVDKSTGDGAPDPMGIIPFYNNESIEKLVTNLNQFARDAAGFIQSQKPTFSA